MMLFAKIHMYTLNAYVDAQIAEELVTYIKTNGTSFATTQTVPQQRAKALITTVNTTDIQKDPSYIIGLAYTEYYINGLADILYADLFWSMFVSPKKSSLRTLYNESLTSFRARLSTTYQYEEFTHQPAITLWYWPVLVANPWKWAAQFARNRCGYTGKLDTLALKKACIEVQHQNMQHNTLSAQVLLHNEKSSDPKINEVRNIANKVDNSKAFIAEAAATQKAAIQWDKIVIKVLAR